MPDKADAISTLRQVAAPVLVFASFFLLRPDHALYGDPGFVAVVLVAGAICGGVSSLLSIPSAVALAILVANWNGLPNYRAGEVDVVQLFVAVLSGVTFLAGAGALLSAIFEEYMLNRDGIR
jgi:hypothetical protein